MFCLGLSINHDASFFSFSWTPLLLPNLDIENCSKISFLAYVHQDVTKQCLKVQLFLPKKIWIKKIKKSFNILRAMSDARQANLFECSYKTRFPMRWEKGILRINFQNCPYLPYKAFHCLGRYLKYTHLPTRRRT